MTAAWEWLIKTDDDQLRRVAVPGGWLYQVNKGGWLTPTFVADPTRVQITTISREAHAALAEVRAQGMPIEVCDCGHLTGEHGVITKRCHRCDCTDFTLAVTMEPR